MTQSRPRRKDRGVSLIIVLVFITILSAVGAFAVRRAVFGEGLARNLLDVEIARQAAEAALRDAERDLRIPATGTVQGTPVCSRNAAERPISRGYLNFDSNCTRGQCRFVMTYYASSNFSTGTNPEPWWPSTSTTTTLWNNSTATKPPGNCTFTGGVPLGSFTGAPAIRGVSRQPEYLIEYMSRGALGLKYYRITSRGWGLDLNSEIVLQTYFYPKG